MSTTRTWRQKLSFGNIGAVYVWILIIVIFSIVVPEHFLTGFTPRNIVNNYTISGWLRWPSSSRWRQGPSTPPSAAT